MASIDASRVINGTYGYVYLNGEWLGNVYGIEATITINTENLRLCGDTWEKHKVISKSGKGTIRAYKVTSKFVQILAQYESNKTPVFELIIKLDDPEAYGYERVRLKNVKFTGDQPVVNFRAGELVEEEREFTFEGWELLDWIRA